MAPSRGEQLQALFLEALELDESGREALLRKIAQRDEGLTDDLRRLLAQENRTPDFLKTAGLQPDSHLVKELLEPAILDSGVKFDGYRIERLLGEGGMGSVYLAHQHQPIRRKVALKVARQVLSTPDMQRRFELEQQALAELDHPNVAHVYDAGRTPSGLPYFVMEYVDGVPVHQYSNDAELSDVDDLLQVFVQVCRGIHHAHQRGILHRDIKPSNILVTVVDGRARPKVIDFGIAKLVQEDSEGPLTRTAQMLGTPEFMSPERLDATRGSVDVRSDVFSLGVVLYQLLSGRVPDRPSLVGVDEKLRPSDRADKTRARTLRGNLDWITMRAMSEDPDRRYPSAEHLAEDVERHLRNEPVLAGPPTARYRARQFVKRNRTATFIGSASIVLLLVATITSTVFFLRARSANRAILSESERTQRVQLVLEDILAEGNPISSRSGVQPGDLIDVIAAKVKDRLGNDPQILADVQRSLGRTYMSLGRHQDALRLFQEQRNRLAQRRSADSGATLTALTDIAHAFTYAGRYSTSDSLLAQIEASQRQLFGDDHSDVARTLISRADVALRSGNRLRGHDLYRQALRIAEHRPDAPTKLTLDALEGLARSATESSDRMGYHRQAYEFARARLRPEDPAIQNHRRRYALSLIETGDRETGVSELHAMLEDGQSRFPDDPGTFKTMVALAGVDLEAGHLQAALALHRQALTGRERVFGHQHYSVATSLIAIGEVQEKLGELEDAQRSLEEGLAIRRVVLPDHPVLIDALRYMGEFHARRQQWHRAVEYLEEAVAAATRILPDDPRTLQLCQNSLEEARIGLTQK